MTKRRSDYLVAALLLTALVASLSLLARPSGNASASSSGSSPTVSSSSSGPLDLTASLRYGCAVSDAPSFVEVTLTPGPHASDPDHPVVVQVGLADKSVPDSTDRYPDAGPTLVTLGSGPIRIRLAGLPQRGDYVFIRQVGSSYLKSVPLPNSCLRLSQTDFGLVEPDVMVAQPGCAGSRATLKVILTNYNTVDDKLRGYGLDPLGYTVLLVHSSGLPADINPAGQLAYFTEPGVQKVSISQAASVPDSYQIRVIGPDGSLDVVGNRRLSCDSVDPQPSRSITPTPIRPSESSTPTSSHPSAHPSTSSHPASSPPKPSATPPASQSLAPRTNTDAPVIPAASSNSYQQALGQGDASSHTAAAKPASTSPAPPRGTAKPRQVEAEAPRLVSVFRMHGMFSGAALLILLVFLVSMAGLVGTTVVSARRR
ncbi:MAG: hypothetical protein M3Y42_11770 [Actinomycetota bacterium]|nr:hypothetical protein [Actinomycetota bacterium]MDQ2957630.1 hypothetical protein [Actinomycetota bacterium]